MKTFIVEVTDDAKAEFVETLLSQLDGVAFNEKNKVKPAKAKKGQNKQVKIKSAKENTVEQVFANTFGMWKGRNIDAKELRRKAWGIE